MKNIFLKPKIFSVVLLALSLANSTVVKADDEALPCGVLRPVIPKLSKLISLKISVSSSEKPKGFTLYQNIPTLEAVHQLEFNDLNKENLGLIFEIPEYGRESIRPDVCYGGYTSKIIEPFQQNDAAGCQGVMISSQPWIGAGRLEAKAFINKQEVTDVLIKNNINIESLGLWRPDRAGEDNVSQLDTLPSAIRTDFINSGLAILENQNDASSSLVPNWKVKKHYFDDISYIKSTSVTMRLEYVPVQGRKELNKLEDVFKTFPYLSTNENTAELKRLAPVPTILNTPERRASLRWITVILPKLEDWALPVDNIEFEIEPGTGEAILLPDQIKSNRSKSGNYLFSVSQNFKELTIYFLKP